MTRRVVAAVALAALAAGCAPHRVVPGAPETGGRAAAYARALAARDAVPDVDLEFSAWPRWNGRALPATHARLLLAAPDAARLRVASAFATALDAAARGDTVTLYLPGPRAAVGVAHARNSLGAMPARAARRVFGASWRPPAPAWQDARMEGSERRVSWTENGDSLSVAVDAAGLPARARWRAASGVTLEVRYGSWTAIGNARWPERLDVSVEPAAVSVAVRVTRARAAAGDARARATVAVPSDATWRTPAEVAGALRRALEGKAEP